MFYPLDPRAEELDIDDIAHALSNMCRFTGHVSEFYSVAQHSMEVANILPEELKLTGLLHDASEAYLVDISRPVKRDSRFSFYREAEAVLEKCIAEKFGLTWPWAEEVKRADNVLLLTEKRDLMGREPKPWQDTAKPLDKTIIPLPPKEAERLFLEYYDLLRSPVA